MIKKKMMVLACTLATCAVMSDIPVAADTVSYNWQFNSVAETEKTGAGYKNDNEQKYYLSINAGNISASNMFGTRIRRSSDNAYMSSYILHDRTKKSVPYSYTERANTNTRYYMRGKKDSASASNLPLNVAGKVTYLIMCYTV